MVIPVSSTQVLIKEIRLKQEIALLVFHNEVIKLVCLGNDYVVVPDRINITITVFRLDICSTRKACCRDRERIDDGYRICLRQQVCGLTQADNEDQCRDFLHWKYNARVGESDSLSSGYIVSG